MVTAFQETHSAEFGRHLVASRDLKPAEVILNQQPYAAVLYGDQVELRCDWCFQTAQQGCTLLRCARSKFAHYCSREHQKAAWRAYYKHECAALVACAPNVPPATVRLAARVLWRRDSELQAGTSVLAQQQQQPQQLHVAARLQQQLSGGSFSDIEALLSHWQQLDDARKLQYAQMAALTRQFMQPGPQQQHQHQQEQQQQEGSDSPPLSPSDPTPGSPDVRQVALLLARFACNNHTICDEELRAIGVGLYPLGALVNHSCSPNCMQSFNGRNIVFRSLTHILSGHQLSISYIELAATRQERRRQLMEQYFFDIDNPTTSTPQQQQLGDHVHRKQQQQQQQQQHVDIGPGTTSEPAAAAGPSSSLLSRMQEAGLHKLRLLIHLPPLPGTNHHQQQQQQQQQLDQQELLLWSTTLQDDTSSCSSSGSSGKIETSVTPSRSSSSSSSKPPWPVDTVDPQLCEMVLLQPALGLSSSSSSSSSSQRWSKLPGGMSLLPAVGAAATSDSAASAAVLAGLFKDLEGLGSSNQNIHGANDNMNGALNAMNAMNAMNSDLKSEVKRDLDGGEITPQQQQQQELEVVQWGDWVPVLQQAAITAAGALVTGSSNAVSAQQQMLPTAAVATAAGLLLQVWQLQQQAEQMNRQGDAAAAVKLCQAALEAADGVTPPPPVQLALASTAAAADAEEVVAPQEQPLCDTAAVVTARSSSAQGVRVVLGKQHVLRLRVLAALLCAAVGAAEWQVALQAARQLVPLYELVYPKVWPNLGLHYATLAKLEMLLEKQAAAARAAETAIAILRVTHGGDSPVLQEMERTRYQAGHEAALAARIAQMFVMA